MKPLRAGGTIGVASPASPYDARPEVLRRVEWWEGQGYKVKLAEGVYALTKPDGSAKGGIAIAIAHELSLPVKLIGIGEGIDDLRPFDPKDFARALVGEA